MKILRPVIHRGFFLAAFIGCSLAQVAMAGEPTAFQLMKLGNDYVGKEARDKVVQIRSEKSIGSLTPAIWYVVYYDADATFKATEVKFAAGKKTDEAVEISKAIGKPVQVVWTRSDDMRFGFFQPPGIVRIAGAFDAAGKPLAWDQRSVGSDLSMFGFPSEKELADPRHYFNDGSPWGSFDNPYNFPNLKADFVRRNSPVPTGPWRAVEYPAQVFVTCPPSLVQG